ncbi:hypothetical protein V5279_37935 [Bradyrhizobium sp. 26S5]|uniref:hypothetical protein n=1 Tax=Bradyrhizobium sp. 26S5 TaxID=3139729 RepID=UPI0030CBD88E
MKSGRKSQNELATIVVGAGKRMPSPPPAELTDAQAMVWRDSVGSMPGEWLTRAAYPILIAYCRHACRARLLEMQIAKFEPEWTRVDGGLERLDKMLAMAERETRAISACARALRLTPQAQMHPRTAGRRLNDAPQGARPWE